MSTACHHCNGRWHDGQTGVIATAVWEGQTIAWLCSRCIQPTQTGRIDDAIAVSFVHRIRTQTTRRVTLRSGKSIPAAIGKAVVTQLAELVRSWPALQETAEARLRQHFSDLTILSAHIADLEKSRLHEPESNLVTLVELVLARETYAARDKQKKDYEHEWSKLLTWVEREHLLEQHVSPTDDVAFLQEQPRTALEAAQQACAMLREIQAVMSQTHPSYELLQHAIGVANAFRADVADWELETAFWKAEQKHLAFEDAYDYISDYDHEDIDAKADYDDHDVDRGDEYD
jgi:hypothetical protein